MQPHEKLNFEMDIDQLKYALPMFAEVSMEYFKSLKVAGFNDEQALYITGQFTNVLFTQNNG